MNQKPTATRPQGDAARLNEQGLACHRRGDMAGAERHFAQALRSSPGWPEVHVNLANLMRDLGRYQLSEKGYRYALTLDAKNAAAWRELGRLYFNLRKRDDAISCFRRAVDSDPSSETGWVRLLDALERTNRVEEALAALPDAKKRFKDSPGIALQEARLLRRAGRAAEAVPAMQACEQRILKELPPNHPFFCEFYFELGQVYDRADDAPRAFDAFTRANRAQAAGEEALPFKNSTYLDGIRRLKSVKLPAPSNEPAPVFLVGFPRSGTTLLDQILSSHPKLFVAEEKPALDTVIRRLTGKAEWWADDNYAARVAGIADTDIAALQQAYYAAMGEVPADKALVDKLPLNMLQLPLIRRVFPGAKVILALRHPCDSVLSCFMQRFAMNHAMANFMDITQAAKMYDAAFSLWDSHGGAGTHAVKYEDVVADFRPTVEGVLDYIGAGWDDAVLAHDKTAKDRKIFTPSYNQVTEKIYTRAAGRWLRYREQLAPVLDILRPHAEKHGYDMGEKA